MEESSSQRGHAFVSIETQESARMDEKNVKVVEPNEAYENTVTNVLRRESEQAILPRAQIGGETDSMDAAAGSALGISPPGATVGDAHARTESEELRDTVSLKPRAGVAPGESSRNFLPDFTGHWRVDEVWNLDPLLAVAGAPWIVRKLLHRSFSRARMNIVQKKNVLLVEDKSIPKDKKSGSMLRFVEGVDNHRKDAYGFKILERCRWHFDQDLGRFVWTLETHGYHPREMGPVVSKYYLSRGNGDLGARRVVLVSEVSFNGEMMKRHWVREDGMGEESKGEGESMVPGAAPASASTAPPKSFASLDLGRGEEGSLSGGVKVLVYGRGGWLACQVAQVLVREGVDFEFGEGRLEDAKEVARCLDEAKPTHVINAAGVTPGEGGEGGGVDAGAAVSSNVAGAANLGALCYSRGLHLTHFSELDPPSSPKRPSLSMYHWTKKKGEECLSPFLGSVLIVRLGLTITGDLKHPSSGFARLVRTAAEGGPLGREPRRVSCLPELLPMAVKMCRERRTGKVDLVNPGRVSEHALFTLIRSRVMPDLEWEAPDLPVNGAGSKEGKEGDGKLEGALAVRESLEEYVLAPNDPEQGEAERKTAVGFLCGLGACAPINCFNVYDSCQHSFNHV